MKPIIGAVAGLAMVALTATSAAQTGPGSPAPTYPSKPVRVIVPFPPGGPTDTIGRLLALKLAEELKSTFYVENLPGAGGQIGLTAAANAAADGYSIVVVTPDVIVTPLVKTKVAFDAFKSFAPVSLVATAPEVISAHPSVPAKNIQELFALMRANPGKYNYATPGYGTPPHLSGERLYRLSQKLDVVHVPFQGAAPAVASTVAGHTLICHMNIGALSPAIKAGTLRGIAIATADRSPVLPDVPTLDESGVPDHRSEFIVGVMVPAGTPGAVVELLHRHIARIVRGADVSGRLAALGYQPVGNTPEEFAAKLRADDATWSKVVRDAKIKLE
jgi:tripartite-type tricarboxylate transporter receptor subunit TctC